MQDIAIAIVFAITGWMLKTWLSHREKMTALSLSVKRLDSSEERLARVEQTVEATALEVERVGEGQRYLTRMLQEGALPSRDGVALEEIGTSMHR
jgi:hypothetical protein